MLAHSVSPAENKTGGQQLFHASYFFKTKKKRESDVSTGSQGNTQVKGKY